MVTVLRAEHLTKRFGGLEAVKDVSFGVDEGEVVGLIGPNGSGKTTTMNMLGGFAPPTAGEAYLRDERITGQPSYAIARQGLVRTFQVTSVFKELTVLHNVIHGGHLRGGGTLLGSLVRSAAYRRAEAELVARAHHVLDFVGIPALRREVPAKHLSAGEQRYLEIAIALAAEPDVVLLDEPATGLNQEETSKLVNLISNMREDGRTIVLVEHNMRMVMDVCDRIVVLNLGHKIAHGTPAEIAADAQVIEAYLGRRRVDA